jgi:pimeloyl-ACP methyl ester carboxylesterase
VVARSIATIGIVAALGLAASDASGEARLVAHPEVTGADTVAAEVRRQGGAWAPVAWDDMAHTTLEPGRYEVREHAATGEHGDAIEIPQCAGRGAVRVDSRIVGDGPGPIVVPVEPGPHEVVIEVEVSRYERRIACGQRVRAGRVKQTTDGLGTLEFDSPHAGRGGGRAVVYVPPEFDLHQIHKVLVGLHPWNGSIWTYAAYAELLGEARAHGVVLLMPGGLGNSLYTADAEDEVLRAIRALVTVIGTTGGGDPLQTLDISLWGASMGGAGATTIGFHHPDRFATVTSFFGDSSYDMSTYVRSILVTQRGAHLVNALDVVDNARNLPVWLIHGEDDATSPIRQSEMLADAMRQRGYPVRFDRIAGIGHSGALVARFLPELVRLAATAQTERDPARVTYRSVRPSDVCAYGVHFVRNSEGRDAFFDIESRGNPPRVFRAEGVTFVGGPGTPCTIP